MVEKITITVCHYGGHFVTNNDGSLQYKGGGAKAFDIRHSTTVNEVKLELALEMKCDSSALKLRYFLPGDTKTPLSIVLDRDLQRMVEFHEDARTIHVYVLNEDNADREASLVIDSRVNKANVGDSTSIAGPTSSPENRLISRINDIASNPSGSSGKPLLSCSWDKVIVGVGQEFKSVKDFRCALGKLAISGGFHFNFIKNDSNRVTVKCRNDNCKWRVHASKLPKTPTFKIKKYDGSHTCGGGADVTRHPHATKHWVAEVIKDKLQDFPHYKPREIIDDLYRDYGIQLRYHQAWRWMELAREMLRGSPLKGYDNLPRFCRRVIETNPGSHAVLNTTEESRFKGLFVSFHASQFGFNEGCRPVIFLNGTSLKERRHESILSATSIDADNGMFPVAFGIVDSEDEANWIWFLNELKQVIRSNRRITFISSIHKELMGVVSQMVQDGYYSICMNQLSQHFQNEVKGGFSVEVREYMVYHLWRAAYATTIADFEKETSEIRKISEDAFNWVQQSQPDHWSNAYFLGDRYNHMTNDATKLVDEWVFAVCDLPILKLVHEISCKMMELMDTRRKDSEKWDTKLTPSVEEYLKNDILKSHTKQVVSSSGDNYEVWDDVIRVVDTGMWTCTCKQWQIHGRPCSHAIAVFNQMDCSPYDFCSPYLTTEMYRLTYSNPICPVPDDGYSEDGEHTPVHPPLRPPLLKWKSSKPRKKAVQSVGEMRSVHCSRCGGTKHNKVTCKEPLGNPQLEQNYGRP